MTNFDKFMNNPGWGRMGAGLACTAPLAKSGKAAAVQLDSMVTNQGWTRRSDGREVPIRTTFTPPAEVHLCHYLTAGVCVLSP